MNIVLLVTDEMKPIPDSIEVVDDWGCLSICDDKGVGLAAGDHMCVSGDDEDFREWLHQCGKVWIGEPGTSPQAQKFEARYVAAPGEAVDGCGGCDGCGV